MATTAPGSFSLSLSLSRALFHCSILIGTTRKGLSLTHFVSLFTVRGSKVSHVSLSTPHTYTLAAAAVVVVVGGGDDDDDDDVLGRCWSCFYTLVTSYHRVSV